MKTIIKNFTREFSVWQQELEIEANLKVVSKDMGIKCSLFIFNNTEDNKVTAYRIKTEQENLPKLYLKLAKNPGYSEKVYKKANKLFNEINQLILLEKFNLKTLKSLRRKIIALWPAYLYGYNIFRYYEKTIFNPANETQRKNLAWAQKLHYLLEGIYDQAENKVMLEIKKLDKSITNVFLSTNEIYKLFTGNKISIHRRLPFVVDETGIVEIEFPSYLINNKLKLVEENKKSGNLISGKIAQIGKVEGRVRILSKRQIENFKNFKKGEILVATATSPVFLPVIRKATAIITDEGGMACHAAIIAREYKIPCIVGTKNATSLLKTGDLIQINADNGTIKILKKEKNV